MKQFCTFCTKFLYNETSFEEFVLNSHIITVHDKYKSEECLGNKLLQILMKSFIYFL